MNGESLLKEKDKKMKRTGFKQKLTVPLKKTKLGRKGKSPIAKLQQELWQECRRVALTLYKPQDGIYRCFTCDNAIEGSNRQLGHFIPKSVSGALLKYDLKNLRWQCFRCNINLSGNGSEFYRRLVEKEGQEYVDELFKLKGQTTKALDHYLKLLEKYKLL